MSQFIKPKGKETESGRQSRPVHGVPADGIHAVHVDAAREMVKLHTRGRVPNATTPVAMGAPPTQTSASSFPRVPNVKTSNLNKSNDQAGSKVCVPAKGLTSQCANPQCAHCGSVIIPSPALLFPVKDEPLITINDWSIYTLKKPILNSAELDYLAETRFDFPLPEMIFGNNVVRLVNDKTGQSIEFNALDALDTLDSDCEFKVSYHKEWLDSRRAKKPQSEEHKRLADKLKDIGQLTENLDVMKPYDWTYSPNYKGTCTVPFVDTSESIPINKLLQPDPILFYDESILFEDELGDNGIAIFSTKIRVMPQVLLLLCRFFLRIDNVIFRIRDTRIFVDFATNQVLREYKEQELGYDELLKKCVGKTNDPKSLLRDPQWVSQNIPVIRVRVEESKLGELKILEEKKEEGKERS